MASARRQCSATVATLKRRTRSSRRAKISRTVFRMYIIWSWIPGSQIGGKTRSAVSTKDNLSRTERTKSFTRSCRKNLQCIRWPMGPSLIFLISNRCLTSRTCTPNSMDRLQKKCTHLESIRRSTPTVMWVKYLLCVDHKKCHQGRQKTLHLCLYRWIRRSYKTWVRGWRSGPTPPRSWNGTRIQICKSNFTN